MNNETMRTATDLNSIERADAIARIARKLGNYTKVEFLSMDFTTVNDTTTVVFSYDTVMKGLTVFTNGKLSNMPNKEYSVSVIAPITNLSKYLVTFVEKSIKGEQTELDIAICSKFSEDLKDDLLTVNLLPLTRTRKN